MPTNKPEYIRAYQKKRYRERRELAITILGPACSADDCDSKIQLEVDHINPVDKRYDFSRLYNLSMTKFIDELKKCQLLCRVCHEKKNRVDAGFRRGWKIRGGYKKKALYSPTVEAPDSKPGQ